MAYTVKDFEKDECVTYVPTHANGDINHPDVENGIVSSVNEFYVFVKYIHNNIVNTTAAATKATDLVKGHH